MTANSPDDPDRVAEELRRRERRRPEREPVSDPAVLRAQFDAQKAEIATIVGEAEDQLSRQIATLARAQGALAETLKKEIASLADRIAKAKETQGTGDRERLEGALARYERVLKNLEEGLPAMEKRLTASLDEREGAVFSGIDAVAGRVAPGAEALVAISEKVETGARAVDDVLKMTASLDSVIAKLDASNRGIGRLRRFGLVALALLALLLILAGVALQRETGVWPPDADSDTAWREHVWERYGEDLKACIEEARGKGQGMACPVFDMDP